MKFLGYYAKYELSDGKFHDEPIDKAEILYAVIDEVITTLAGRVMQKEKEATDADKR